MSYSELLLAQFTELCEKHDALNKLNSREILHNYGHSEIHCIHLIGKCEQPNVTKISSKLAMTKSAISRIVKKLLDNGDIESYQLECNKKEIYRNANREINYDWMSKDYLKVGQKVGNAYRDGLALK